MKENHTCGFSHGVRMFNRCFCFYFPSATMVDAEIQVNFDEIEGNKDNCSSGIDTASAVTEKLDVEDCRQEGVENLPSQHRTFDLSIESRNFLTPEINTRTNYAALRLASPFLPSPLLDRRTIL